ncbi:MAG: nucleotidyltransferase family protein [Bacteroidaceae bacterium]|nr:nucleotidyltransferase family protein [Bacteroidaceae bacterium]
MLFFELLQIAIGYRDKFSHAPTIEEWRELFALAQKQAMVGVAFCGVERLSEEHRPPKSLLMQWYVATERIKTMNADLDRKALAVAGKFLDEGFPGVVLKGQGIAKLYRGPHSNPFPRREDLGVYRTPGDIDIWLHGERKDILRYVHRHVPDCKPVYHHVDFPVIDGLDIEVHFTPSWMNSPITNRRLQRWFRSFDFQFSNFNSAEIPSPSLAFNRVYILVHIYRHLFAEGIGLRQLLDYYFVLAQGFTEVEREATMRTLRSLKMQRFTAAVMWVLQEVYGMDERYLLTAPDEREGRFLLGEIMLAGNFGQYDERMQHERDESALHWGVRKVKRNFRFVRSYPSEVLWSPLFKLWHYFWRKGLRIKGTVVNDG